MYNPVQPAQRPLFNSNGPRQPQSLPVRPQAQTLPPQKSNVNLQFNSQQQGFQRPPQVQQQFGQPQMQQQVQQQQHQHVPYQQQPFQQQFNQQQAQQPTQSQDSQQYRGSQQGTQGAGMQDYITDFQSSATGQIGMQLGTQAFNEAQKQLNTNVGRYVNLVQWRYYFNVSNSYVLNKIQVLLFPFMHKGWTRIVEQMDDNGQAGAFAAPRSDLNAPDLYIPVMSFVTYIIIVGIASGINKANASSFSPDVLGITASTASLMILCEVLLIKLGNYLLNVSADASFMDLTAYTGYKFTPICVVCLIKFVAGAYTKIFSFIYFFFAFGFFTLRSLRNVVVPDNEVSGTARKRRVVYLFIIVLLQTAVSWILI